MATIEACLAYSSKPRSFVISISQRDRAAAAIMRSGSWRSWSAVSATLGISGFLARNAETVPHNRFASSRYSELRSTSGIAASCLSCTSETTSRRSRRFSSSATASGSAARASKILVSSISLVTRTRDREDREDREDRVDRLEPFIVLSAPARTGTRRLPVRHSCSRPYPRRRS